MKKKPKKVNEHKKTNFFVSLHMAANKIIIITAPSGAGKTSIVKYLLEKHQDQLAFSISAATRSPRNNEKNGIDYYFMTVAEFNTKINAHQFIEWEMVYEGKYYGTLKSEIERIWALGKTPILDIDVQGAIHVQQQFPDNALSIFIQPPSVEALRNRLKSRGTETEATLKTRVDKASYELSFKDQFNIAIINDVLETACAETEQVVLNFIKN
jgi:guanylate kinase